MREMYSLLIQNKGRNGDRKYQGSGNIGLRYDYQGDCHY
jgi:hypothetical protein